MASQEEIGRTYNWVDELFRLSIGETGDYTGAFYQGDFSKTLDQAQADKRAHILDGIGFGSGQRVLDIGCGWGPMLAEVRNRGGQGVGLTISTAQHQACVTNGLDARLLDYKEADPSELGRFDGVFSVGAFEAFCSIDEYENGEQDEVYRKFFEFAASVLDRGGRLYVQTMMWGETPPEPSDLDLRAPRGFKSRPPPHRTSSSCRPPTAERTTCRPSKSG
jgi:cyclopropane-fatty-acyl-phospholipid synthase